QAYSEPGYVFLDRYTRDLPGVERMSIFSAQALVNSYVNGVRIASSLKRTDGEYWKILDFPFLEGGPFTSDDVANARFVAVVSVTTRRPFFGDGPALGKTLEADGQRFRVVGVVEDVPELRTVPFAEIWVPLTTAKSDAYRHQLLGDFLGIYLARSRDDFPAIREEFRSRLKTVELPRDFTTIYALPETPMEHVASAILGGTPFHQLVVEDTGDISLVRFWGAAALLGLLFMLLPTLNLVNLQVSRIL